MAALPSQRLKFRKYRSKIDPVYGDTILIFGLVLLVLGTALDLSDIGFFGSTVAGFSGVTLLAFFILGLLRAQLETFVYILVLLISIFGGLASLYMGFSEPIDFFLHENKALCALLFSNTECRMHAVFSDPASLKGISDYLLVVVLGLYFGLAFVANLKTHRLAMKQRP